MSWITIFERSAMILHRGGDLVDALGERLVCGDDLAQLAERRA